jgi:uncharacterized membrane protein HdeD (DUF308 family)
MRESVGPSWSSFAWRGALSIAFGAIALAWPGVTLAVLVILFGAYAFADGVLALVVAGRRGPSPHRGWLLLDGVLGIAAGLLTLFWPSIGLLTLVLVVGFRAILAGATQIGAAVQLRHTIASPGLLGLAGVLTVIFGVTAVAMPGITAVVLVTILGVYAIFFGASLVGFAFMIRREGRKDMIAAPGRAVATPG